MEELQKLERTQSMMMFLESKHLFSPNISNDSHLFLSKFHLFLMEPCGNLSVDDKCSLLSQHLPKISASLVEKALVGLPGKSEGFVRDYMTDGQVKEDISGYVHDLRGQSSLDDDMALIGLESMQRANSTLEDFCRSYFMFHGMEVTRPECLFKYLPVLSFTESYIYQLDSLNEKMVDQIRSKTIAEEQRSCEEACKFMKAIESQPFQSLLRLLQHHELLTPRINEELRQGEEYWALERKLCTTSEQISIEDVMRAIHLKSFDYRVLNLLLYQLRGEEVNDLHMEFLTVSEFLVEISDDLFDYEEDVLENNFNILRMLLRIYEPSAAPTMLAKYITEAEEKYEDLAKDLEPELYMSYQRRCEEATKEGGKIAGHPLGSWTIPPLILDEDLYRSSMQV